LSFYIQSLLKRSAWLGSAFLVAWGLACGVGQAMADVEKPQAFKEPFSDKSSQGPLELTCQGGELLGRQLKEGIFKSTEPLGQQALIQSMRSAESQCLKNASYYALLGQMYLLAHLPKEALESLERSLLIEPNQPGVLFDFALSLAESGDTDSAKVLIDQIMLRPDVPSTLRQSITQILARQKSEMNPFDKTGPSTRVLGSAGFKQGEEQVVSKISSDGSSWIFSGNLGTMLGADSNLNSASFVNTVNLTLPNGVVALNLDPTSLPQKGRMQLGTAQWVAQRSIGDNSILLSASWMGRQTPENAGLGFNNEEFVAHFKPGGDLGWHQRAVLNHFELGGSNFYNGLSWSNWWESDVSREAASYFTRQVTCHTKFGVDVDRRTYAQDVTQNGIYLGLMMAGLCGTGQDQFNLTLQEGKDWASDAFRAGGNQRRMEIKAQWFHFFEKDRFGVELGQQWLRDSTTYSELLGGIDRKTQRNSVRMSYQYQIIEKLGMIRGSLAWVTSLEKQNYRSTISLFNLRGESFQTGLKWEF